MIEVKGAYIDNLSHPNYGELPLIHREVVEAGGIVLIDVAGRVETISPAQTQRYTLMARGESIDNREIQP